MQDICALTVSLKTVNPAGTLLAGTTEPDVRVRIRRRIVQIQREHSGIRAIVPIAATDQARNFLRKPYPFILYCHFTQRIFA